MPASEGWRPTVTNLTRTKQEGAGRCLSGMSAEGGGGHDDPQGPEAQWERATVAFLCEHLWDGRRIVIEPGGFREFGPSQPSATGSVPALQQVADKLSDGRFIMRPAPAVVRVIEACALAGRCQ